MYPFVLAVYGEELIDVDLIGLAREQRLVDLKAYLGRKAKNGGH